IGAALQLLVTRNRARVERSGTKGRPAETWFVSGRGRMGKHRDIFRAAQQSHHSYDKNDIKDKTYTNACTKAAPHNPQYGFGRICCFGRSFDELERRCPDQADIADWQEAVEDARRFLARWGEQAEVLAWTT